jgi:hypothetical protein
MLQLTEPWNGNFLLHFKDHKTDYYFAIEKLWFFPWIFFFALFLFIGEIVWFSQEFSL